jgi:hypothetical protein
MTVKLICILVIRLASPPISAATMTYTVRVPLEACSSSFSTSSIEAATFGLAPANAAADGNSTLQRKKKISEKITDLAPILQKIRKTWKSKRSLQEESTPPPEFWW